MEDESEDEDELIVFGDDDSLPQAPFIQEDPVPPLPPPPPEPDEPLPLPPIGRPYRRWWELPPPRKYEASQQATRWVTYDTDAFSSEMLRPWDPTHPFPFPVARLW